MKKEFTGYPSLDLPHTKGSSFFERNPIVPSMDITTLINLINRKNKDAIAIICNELKATYRELEEDGKTLEKAYRELGVKRGDIVTISLKSNYQALLSFIALNSIGAVTTYVDTYSSEEDIIKYLNEYESPIFINYNATKEENKKIKDNTKVKYIITLDEKNENNKDIFNDYNINQSDYVIDFNTLGTISKYQNNRIYRPNKGNDNALILYTSGSSGKQKAVVLTNKNIIAAQMYAGNTSHTENITATRTMTCVPLRYPYGMVTSLLTSLLWNKTAIMTPDWDTKTVNYYLSKDPHIIFGSPAVLELVMRFVDEKADLSRISHFISGGDFLTENHAERAYEFFKQHNNYTVEIGNGCGNAETVSIGSTPVGVPLKQNTAGKILVGSRAMIIDSEVPDDKPIKDGNSIKENRYFEVGELCISGKHVFKEYFNDPEATKKAKFIRNGVEYFRTGTLGYIDLDGYFVPTDRKSRFYIRSTGHKVYLDNVQKVIATIDKRIVDTAAIEIPDDNELFINKVYIVLENGVLPTKELKEELMDKIYNSNAGQIKKLKEYELPKDIEFIDILPRRAGTEKIDYKALKEIDENLNNELTRKLKKH